MITDVLIMGALIKVLEGDSSSPAVYCCGCASENTGQATGKKKGLSPKVNQDNSRLGRKVLSLRAQIAMVT